MMINFKNHFIVEAITQNTSPKNPFWFNNLLRTHFKRKYTRMELPPFAGFLKIGRIFLPKKTFSRFKIAKILWPV